MEEKIPKSKNTFYSFLKDPNSKSIFLKEVTQLEVLLIIKGLNSSKACGPNSIPTKILIQCSEIIVEPLVKILNMSLK